jgi:3'-5' exoribonuclease
MKRQYIDMLQEGDRVDDYFVAVRKDLRDQSRGGKFLGMVFKDRTGEIGGILWNNAAAIAQLFEVGDVVSVKGLVGTHQDRLQVRVEQVLPLRDGEFDPADLVYQSPEAQAEREAFEALLRSIEDPHLKQLVEGILADDALMAAFCASAAGKRWHHAHRGGLLSHCLEMARIGETMAQLYPDLDRDLLLVAVLVHDLGKTREMTHELMVEYTTEGRLLGHLHIGAEEISRRCDAVPGFPESLKLRLLHCILSHHGEQANGSPVVPKTLEAVVLHHVDNLSAQASAFSQIIGEARNRGDEWSGYLPLIDRQIWAAE